jgi:hypothetical protein
MTQIRFRSLQAGLAVQLAGLYILAMAIAVGILVYQAYDTAGTLNDRDLNLRTADLARYVSVTPKEEARLDLPAKLAAAYQSPASSDIFAVRSAGGRIIAASPSSFGELVAGWPAATDDASYFHLKAFGSESQDYYCARGRRRCVGPFPPAGIRIRYRLGYPAPRSCHSCHRNFCYSQRA